MENEIWKDIPEWEGLYKVSNMGRCFSVRKNQIKPLAPNNYGYLRVHCYDGERRKKFFVHRLVASLFVNGYSDGLVVNHKDGDRQNNAASNLEWVTKSANTKHAVDNGMIGLKFEKVPCYLEKDGLKVYFESVSQAARSIGVGGKRLHHLMKTNDGFIPEVGAFIFKCVSND